MHTIVGTRVGLVVVLVAIVGLTSAGPAVATSVGQNGRIAEAGDLVDPSTLTPEPPPGATCWAVTRASTLCTTARDLGLTKEPVFSLACGKVYETSVDHRDGVRWYVDGKAVRRYVHGRI